MKRTHCVGRMIMLMVSLFLVAGLSTPLNAGDKAGEKEFKEHCAMCHPNGGNIINPKKTLQKKDRDANAIRSAEDIVKLMRKPGPGMTVFDEKTIPDKEAKEIANYIMKTFK